MAKRKAGSDDGSPHSKRKKLTQTLGAQQHARPPLEDVQTLNQLQSLLSSTQLEVDDLLQRIRSFRAFLDGVAPSESGERSAKIDLLLEYLRTQVSTEEEESSRLVPDVVKIGHHAGQINSENLFSSTAAVIALLLKTISSLHEFRSIGNSLCRLLLHEDHIKLIEHGMSAAKSKEHLISPCLRLLKEIVLFDGGRAAKIVYRLRHITYQRLDIFLSMRGIAKDIDRDYRKRPSIRNNTISYLLANIRLQSQAAKRYILAQNRWMRSLLSEIGNDPPGLVLGILDAFKKEVAEDRTLPLSVKGHFFDDWTLIRLATLYSYKGDDELDNEAISIADSAHTLLHTICASSEHGLLNTLHNKQRLGLAVDDSDDSDDEVNPSNKRDIDPKKIHRNIFFFLQRLRPHASAPQCDLLLSCFQISPQLVDNFFSDKAAFSFDPKLTATWIGYSQFLLGIIQQPFPEDIFRKSIDGDEASTRRSLDNCILPPPMTRKALTQCLNQRSGLLTFFTTRILVAAFEKLTVARKMLKSKQAAGIADSQSQRKELESRLIGDFCKRCPSLKDVIVQFKSCPAESIMLRESISRLLAFYYKTVPQLALEENADLSAILSNALAHLDEENNSVEKDGMRLLDLGHLIEIASLSPNMQWFHKPDSRPLSPFTSLLKAHVQQKQHGNKLGDTLKSVAEENSLTWPGKTVSGFEVLVFSLRFQKTKHEDKIYFYLDNCFMRLVKKTVLYADRLDDLISNSEDKGAKIEQEELLDLLIVTILEQLHHLMKRESNDGMEAVAQFLRLYIDFSLLRGVSRRLLVNVRDTMKVIVSGGKEASLRIGAALQEPLDEMIQEAYKSFEVSSDAQREDAAIEESCVGADMESEVAIPPGPPAENEDHRGLTKWTREDTQDAIADGAFGELILCLCSEHEQIRKEALANIKIFTRKLETSGYSEFQQVHVLAGEIVETADNFGLDRPLPYFAGILASRLLQVLADPLHLLYEKVNRFLNKGPLWTVEKLPSYWTDKILLHPPTDDDGHYQEVEWLLETLINGLRTPTDMEIYRNCHIFERILTLFASPKLPTVCLENVIDLLFRCTYVEGSTTLFTRCGLMSWLSIHIGQRSDSLKSKLKVLGQRAYETSDQTRVDEWSKGSLASTLDRLDVC